LCSNPFEALFSCLKINRSSNDEKRGQPLIPVATPHDVSSLQKQPLPQELALVSRAKELKMDIRTGPNTSSPTQSALIHHPHLAPVPAHSESHDILVIAQAIEACSNQHVRMKEYSASLYAEESLFSNIFALLPKLEKEKTEMGYLKHQL